jgi:hypothetical protein
VEDFVAAQTQFTRFTPIPVHMGSSSTASNFVETTPATRSLSAVTALSLEFVATPQAVRELHSSIPNAINEALRDVTGFAGCLTMISDQESRLVTVVTFWTGEDREWLCSRTARWVRKLVSPYLDRCLRVQTFHAFLPVASTLANAFSRPGARPSPGHRSEQEDSRRIA